MLWRRKAGTELPLGIAWEEEALRIVDLQPSGAAYQVKALTLPLPREHNGQSQELLVELLKKTNRQYRWGKRNVVTALPPNEVLIRYLKLPSLPAAKVAEEVRREAQQILGPRLADYSFDYMVLDREETHPEQQGLTVMLAAIPRAKALYLCELFTEAGFRLQAIDIVPLALQRALLGHRASQQGHEATVLLDLGRRSSQLAVISHGQLSFARTLPCSFTPEDQERTNTSAPSLVLKAKELLTEMQRSLDYFQAQSRQKAVELIVSGASCRRPGLMTMLQELELKVVEGVPGSGLALDRHPDPSFAVAVGLALKGVRA